MNFSPMYDDRYYEANGERFRPTPEEHECECGAELTRGNPPEICDCGAAACNKCRHKCAICGHEGCESCQTDTGQGWQCNEHVSEDGSVEAHLMNSALDAIYGAMGKEARRCGVQTRKGAL